MKTFSEFNNINENINFTNESKSGLKGVKEYRNGLTPEIVMEKYPWLLKAKFKNAVIGEDKCCLIWYDGVWKSGIWEDGRWKSGTWENGIWQDGEWDSGSWENGTWESGSWLGGAWLDGTWNNGTWYDGQWNYGTWNRGRWRGGEILNQETGKFEESYEPPTEK